MKLIFCLSFLLFLNVVWTKQAQRRVHPKNDPNFHETRDELPHEIDYKRDGDSAKRLSILPYPYYPQQQYQCEMCCNGTRLNGLFSYSSSCCGKTAYDSRTSICCGSNVIAFQPTTTNNNNNYQWQCCGDNNLYNTTSQLCCENVILPKNPLQQCCGNKVYDASTNVCCGSVSTPIPTYNSWSCCASQVYDVTKQQCKDNNLETIQPGITPYACGANTINFQTQICCSDAPVARVNNYTLCCGTQGYQSNEQMCCGGTILQDDHTGTQDCCGTQQINIISQMCCNNNIITTPTGTDCSSYYCCGSELYNSASTTSLCCNEKVNKIPATTKVNPSSGIAISSYLPYPLNNYQCCGSQTYNPQTQTCCGQTTVVEGGSSALCCGNGTYDASKNTCCNNKLYSVGNVPLDICCCPDGACNNYQLYPGYPYYPYGK